MAYQDLLNNLFSGGLLAQDVGLPPDVQQRAQQQALLNAGLSILSGSGRRRGPKTSLAELAAGGIQAGQQGYQGALQSGLDRQTYQTRQEAAKSKQAMRDELSTLPTDQTPDSFMKRAQIFEKYGDYENAQKYYDAAQKFAAKQGEAYTLTPGSVRFGPDGKVIASVAAAERQGADPYYQAVPTPQGYMRFNARTGQMEPIMVGGSVPTPIAADPMLKQQMEQAGAMGRGAGEAAVTKQARTTSAYDTLSLLSEAEKLLPKATGSVAGYAVDQALGGVGLSTGGANATAQLQAIAGQLTAKMPRMEGPQSNYDVQLYKQMAGDLANPLVPNERRMAALKTIRALNEKYAGKPASQADQLRDELSQKPYTQPTKRYNPATGKIEDF